MKELKVESNIEPTIDEVLAKLKEKDPNWQCIGGGLCYVVADPIADEQETEMREMFDESRRINERYEVRVRRRFDRLLGFCFGAFFAFSASFLMTVFM